MRTPPEDLAAVERHAARRPFRFGDNQHGISPAAPPLTARCLRPCRFLFMLGDCAPCTERLPGVAVPAIGRSSSFV